MLLVYSFWKDQSSFQRHHINVTRINPTVFVAVCVHHCMLFSHQYVGPFTFSNPYFLSLKYLFSCILFKKPHSVDSKLKHPSFLGMDYITSWLYGISLASNFSVRNLLVDFDQDLSFNWHIKMFSWSAFVGKHCKDLEHIDSVWYWKACPHVCYFQAGLL